MKACFALGLAAAAAVLTLAGPARAGYTFTYTTFDPPGAQQVPTFGASIAGGVSASGSVIGFFLDADGVYKAYIRFPGGSYLTGSFPGATYTESFGGINDALDATGRYYDANTGAEGGFVFHAGAFLAPTAPGATSITLFNNVNEAGLVAAIYDDAGGNFHSAVYDVATGQFTPVADLPGAVNTYLQTVGANGELLANVDFGGPGLEGRLVENGVITPVVVPGAVRTAADAITPDGRLISGNYLDAHGVRHGFVYDRAADRFYTLDVPGAVDTRLWHGNSQDTFAGYYVDANGITHSFAVTAQAVPEPASAALLGAGVVGLAAVRRRKAVG